MDSPEETLVQGPRLRMSLILVLKFLESIKNDCRVLWKLLSLWKTCGSPRSGMASAGSLGHVFNIRLSGTHEILKGLCVSISLPRECSCLRLQPPAWAIPISVFSCTSGVFVRERPYLYNTKNVPPTRIIRSR